MICIDTLREDYHKPFLPILSDLDMIKENKGLITFYKDNEDIYQYYHATLYITKKVKRLVSWKTLCKDYYASEYIVNYIRKEFKLQIIWCVDEIYGRRYFEGEI